MIDNQVPLYLEDKFHEIILRKVDNKDFFKWPAVANGILMPVP